MKKLVLILIAIATFAACTKTARTIIASRVKTIPVNQYKEYVILKGFQYGDSTSIVPFNGLQLNFVVKFDSSAIYKTIDTTNQIDINKLYGFSDNGKDHHLFSARFGWNWYNNALHLYAYYYNNGVRDFKELGIVNVGKEINCSIKVLVNNYIFSLNGVETSVPRAATTLAGNGYKLFPYFGGDELAPHDIHIWIKELP
jgi:hypothetical protein